MAGAQQHFLIAVINQLAAAGMAVAHACRLVGIARSTHYRISRDYKHYTPVANPIAHADRHQPAALSAAERHQMIEVLTDDDYADLSVVQTYWRAFDDGKVGCSERTAYRIATAQGLVGDRRRRRGGGGGVSRRRPVVVATEPNQLWSWDATELRGPGRDDRYKLSLAIDVFSRYPVAWRIEYHESTPLAVDMFTAAFARHGAPAVLHADNGTVMRSADLMTALGTASTTASFSRPRVSDDNPFSESLFKTIKYDLACPDRFDDIDHARQWTAQFLDRYAHHHRHSGLGRHTPASVFDGTAIEHRARRQRRLDQLWQANPQRYRRPPIAPAIPDQAGINIKHLSQTG
ncbi:IS3 family transposase [Nocardia sp. 348MFTsu5.1]|uniref:IS3 family transposase n=1 Tax=Nocardia sp. 348MFTsu5.1 TaxID=1172185 RepID=UPI0003783AE8|nr:IS3 family transposase [Nocardia sp. 348MFTsu5.1]